MYARAAGELYQPVGAPAGLLLSSLLSGSSRTLGAGAASGGVDGTFSVSFGAEGVQGGQHEITILVE
jgi:hypothetical protein